jgi:hypothetical protein
VGAAVPPFAEAIAGYGDSVSPRRLRTDLGLAGSALARIALRLSELLPDLTALPALQPDEERFRLLDAAAQFFTALSARATVLLVLDDLFAKEMIRHLIEERALAENSSGALEASLPLVAVPEGVRQVLARRCARLPAGANRLAESASGFAEPFLFPVAAAAAGLDDTTALTALDELLAAGLIRPAETPERYEFGHALVRQAISPPRFVSSSATACTQCTQVIPVTW